MASANLAKLQATVNRFAKLGGFSQIAIDGGMGSQTENAVTKALQAAVSASGGIGDDQLAAVVSASAGSARQTVIMQRNVDIETTLAAIANSLGLPPAATVTVKDSSLVAAATAVPNKSAFNVASPMGASLFDSVSLWWRQRPTWQQIGLGVAGAGIVVMGFSKAKKSAEKA